VASNLLLAGALMSSEPTISLTEDPLLFSRNTQILCSEFCLKRNCASKLGSESTNHPWSLRKSNRSVHVLFLLLEYMASPLRLCLDVDIERVGIELVSIPKQPWY
jgi:hypothetical protein